MEETASQVVRGIAASTKRIEERIVTSVEGRNHQKPGRAADDFEIERSAIALRRMISSTIPASDPFSAVKEVGGRSATAWAMENTEQHNDGPARPGITVHAITTEDRKGPDRQASRPDGSFGQDGSRSEQFEGNFQASPISPAPMLSLDPASSPARLILSQLEAPIAAAVKEVLNLAASEPLRHLAIILTPDDLGTVSVTMRLEKNELSIAIRVSSQEVAERLHRDRTMLDDMLRPVIGDAIAPVITIAAADTNGGSFGFESIASGNGSASNSQEPDTGRERQSTGKEDRSQEPDDRMIPHEDSSSAVRSRPGVLVL
jgi:hypothetical protein